MKLNYICGIEENHPVVYTQVKPDKDGIRWNKWVPVREEDDLDLIGGWVDEDIGMVFETLYELQEKFENILGPIQIVRFDPNTEIVKFGTSTGNPSIYVEKY